MGPRFWIRRFLVVFAGAFTIICGVQFLKHRDFHYAVTQGLIWGGITATVFAVARIYQSRRGEHCAICKDTPEMQKSRSDFPA